MLYIESRQSHVFGWMIIWTFYHPVPYIYQSEDPSNVKKNILIQGWVVKGDSCPTRLLQVMIILWHKNCGTCNIPFC
jgi:hypothetical protein